MKVRIGNAYSSWKETFYCIPQASILGPLMFNIFLYDLFQFLEGVAVEPVTPEHFSEVLLNINSGKSHI